MNNKYGVAIASYNGEKYIQDQIESIISQTAKVDRIFISDDNSTDNTIGIINSLIKKGYPITLFQNKNNKGYALNFLNCINKCDSEYIFLCDQDDIWKTHKVERMISFINKNLDSLCWMHDCSLTNNKLEIKINSKIQNLREQFMNEKAFAMGACMVISKKAKSYIFPYPENLFKKYGHDNWIWFVLRATEKLKVLEESLMLYRRHEKNTSINQINQKVSSSKIRLLIKIVINKFIFRLENNKSKIKVRLRDLSWSRQLQNNTKDESLLINKAFLIKI